VIGPTGREWEVYTYKVRFRSNGGRRLRRLASAVANALRAIRADSWTVEAVSRLPQPETYRWRTTSEHKAHVLAQVEGAFADGYVPQNLRHADYLGWSRSAR
jgi:hypothetical protein